MNHIALFNGIGGFQLAAAAMGWNNIASCEIDPFCNRVTKYHFPNCIQHEDIRTTDFSIYRGQCDILTGGFPCQPYSVAGQRKGKDDDRHLWPPMRRTIREVQPSWVVGENVSGLVNWNGGMVFDEVQADLETEGYEVTPFILPACAVNAPHRRDRIWFVAYSEKHGRERQSRGSNDRQTRRISPQRNEYEGCQFIGSGEITPNTDGSRWGRNRGSEDIKQQSDNEGNGSDLLSEIKGYGGISSTANAGSTGQQKCDVPGFATKPGYGTGMANAERYTTDTPQPNEQRYWLCEKCEGLQVGGCDCGKGWFADFPTQSPVCSRDDGLSTRLAGITFSKHRNESIKAYGNAIVPQVALQIFKAIEQWINENTAT